MVITNKQDDLKPVLREKSKKGVKFPYYQILDKDQVLFVVSSGNNGQEFNKTIGYFSLFPGVQTYQCLYGHGIMVMQRNDDADEAKEFKVVSLNSGRVVAVPASWAMGIVNTGSSFLVVLRNSALDEKFFDAKPIIEKQGLAYYVVDKKGEIAFEQNPRYKLHPQITTE